MLSQLQKMVQKLKNYDGPFVSGLRQREKVQLFVLFDEFQEEAQFKDAHFSTTFRSLLQTSKIPGINVASK